MAKTAFRIKEEGQFTQKELQEKHEAQQRLREAMREQRIARAVARVQGEQASIERYAKNPTKKNFRAMQVAIVRALKS